MSLDLFVFAIPNGQDNRFRRAIVEEAFAPYVDDVRYVEWELCLKGGEETFVRMSVEGGELIAGFSINRPPGYGGFPEFWDALYKVLRQTRTFSVLCGSRSDANYCIADPGIIDEVLADIAKDRGGPRVVSSGAELEWALCN